MISLVKSSLLIIYYLLMIVASCFIVVYSVSLISNVSANGGYTAMDRAMLDGLILKHTN